MKPLAKFLLVTSILLLTSFTGNCSDDTIAVVDIGYLIDAHPDTKAAEELLKEELGDYEAEKKQFLGKMAEMKRELETLHDESRNPALSKEAAAQKIEKVEEKLIELRKYQADIREKLNSRQEQITNQKRRMRKRIMGKINVVLHDFAKEKKLSLILDGSTEGLNADTVLFRLERLDITEAVLKEIKKTKSE